MLLIPIFILFPILGLPIYLFTYFFDKNKKGILYSLLIGISFGLMAYHFVPPIHYDLYRHQLITNQFIGKDFISFLATIKEVNLEIIPQVYSYAISMTMNINLLQFFVVSIGYFILFYILYDYRKITGINNIAFISILSFTIFGFHAIYFISGLYYYLAAILFSFAVYNEYIKKSNKILSYILYLIALLMHNSMFFAGSILLLYKLLGNKFNIKSALACIFIFLFAYYILNFLVLNFNITIFNNIYSMYNSYVDNNYRMQIYYRGLVLSIEIIKISITILCLLLQKERNKFNNVNGYILLLLLSTLILLSRSRVMIRFAMIIQFLGIVPMMDYFKKNSKNNVIILFLIIMCSLLFIIHFYSLVNGENFGELSNVFYKNIFKILSKR